MIYCKYMKLKIPCQIFLWRISQSEIRNSAAAEKRGRAKIPSPQPPSFLPARAFGFGSATRSAAMGQFPSKNVRAELYNSTNIKLSDFCPTDSAAPSAGRDGNTRPPPPPPPAPPPPP